MERGCCVASTSKIGPERATLFFSKGKRELFFEPIVGGFPGIHSLGPNPLNGRYTQSKKAI